MNVTETRCDICRSVPRRLSLEIDGKLYCSRDCFLSDCARRWDGIFHETYSAKAPNVRILKREKGGSK